MIHFVWTYLRILEHHNQKQKQMETETQTQEQKQQASTSSSSSNNNQLLHLPIVDVIVPTGAMGNLVGGYMSKCIGIPFGKFVAAVNINDTTHTVISKGIFCKPTFNVDNNNNNGHEMYKTLSEAINIQLVRCAVLYCIASNDMDVLCIFVFVGCWFAFSSSFF